MTDPEPLLAARLADELGDPYLARRFARILLANALTWHAPTAPPQSFDTILAFTFGNRMQPNGNRSPGPVNTALAAIATALQRHRDAPVYAQWEVAEALTNASGPVHPIHPGRDARSEPVYLGTEAVISQVIARAGGAAALGRVGIVAFADHMRRCVGTARRLGLDAWAPEAVAMPRDYDPFSGQPWCRDRLAYLLHDLAVGMAEQRDALCTAPQT